MQVVEAIHSMFKTKRKLMELMTLEDIPLGTEITFDYGPTFFGNNREFCECPFDELRSRQIESPVFNSTPKPRCPVAKCPKLNAQSSPNLRSNHDNQSSFDKFITCIIRLSDCSLCIYLELAPCSLRSSPFQVE